MLTKENLEFLDFKPSWHIPAAAMATISLVLMKIKEHECVKIVEGNK